MRKVLLFTFYAALLVSFESVAHSADVALDAAKPRTSAGMETSQQGNSVPPANSDSEIHPHTTKKPDGPHWLYREDRSDVGAYLDKKSNQIITFSAAEDLRKRNCYGSGFPMAFAGKHCHTSQVHALALSDMSQCKTVLVRATRWTNSLLDTDDNLANRLGLPPTDNWTNQILLKLTHTAPGKRFITEEPRGAAHTGVWEPSYDCFAKLELSVMEMADDMGVIVQGDFSVGRHFHYILPRDLIAMRGKADELMGVPIESISGSGTYWGQARHNEIAPIIDAIQGNMMERLMMHLSGRNK